MLRLFLIWSSAVNSLGKERPQKINRASQRQPRCLGRVCQRKWNRLKKGSLSRSRGDTRATQLVSWSEALESLGPDAGFRRQLSWDKSDSKRRFFWSSAEMVWSSSFRSPCFPVLIQPVCMTASGLPWRCFSTAGCVQLAGCWGDGAAEHHRALTSPGFREGQRAMQVSVHRLLPLWL